MSNLPVSKFLVIIGTLLLPAISFAAVGTEFNDLISAAAKLMSVLVYIVIGVAMILFFWGVIKYVIAGSEDEEKRRDARNLIIYGIIGIFIMVSIWGIVYFLASLLGVTVGGTPNVAGLPAPSGGLGTGADSTLVELIKAIGGWVAKIAVLMIGLALVFFLWGVTRYIASGGDEEKRTEARSVIVYGVIGLFVMIAIWSLVYFIGNTIGITIGGGTTVPQVTNINIGNVGAGNQNITVTGEAFANCEDWATTKSFKAFVCLILKILNPIPPILVALAMIYFFWGVGKYMNSGGDAEKLQNGRITIIFGIIGLFVILAVWGLVALIQGGLGLN